MSETNTLPEIQDLITQEVKKYDEVLPKIEELKAELMPLKINGIADEDGYKKVASAIRFVVSKRTAIEEKRKELKRPHYEIGLAIDAKAKEYIALLAPIEDHLKTQKAAVDQTIAIIEEQKAIQKQKLLQQRNDKLIAAGMSLVGNTYVWKNPFTFAEETIVAINLETMNDEDFDAEVSNITKLEQEVVARKQQEEEQRKAEQEKLRQEQENLRLEQEKLRKQQDEINNQKRLEEESLRKQIIEINNMKRQMRLEMLQSIGCRLSDITGFIFYKNKSLISLPELTMVEDWSAKFAEIKEQVAQIDADIKQQEAQDAEKREKEIQEAADLKAKQLEEEKKKIEDEERERIAGLSDSAKLKEYVKNLLGVEVPEFKTQKFKKISESLSSQIKGFLS
jgi:hypothetical protein